MCKPQHSFYGDEIKSPTKQQHSNGFQASQENITEGFFIQKVQNAGNQNQNDCDREIALIHPQRHGNSHCPRQKAPGKPVPQVYRGNRAQKRKHIAVQLVKICGGSRGNRDIRDKNSGCQENQDLGFDVKDPYGQKYRQTNPNQGKQPYQPRQRRVTAHQISVQRNKNPSHHYFQIASKNCSM